MFCAMASSLAVDVVENVVSGHLIFWINLSARVVTMRSLFKLLYLDISITLWMPVVRSAAGLSVDSVLNSVRWTWVV